MPTYSAAELEQSTYGYLPELSVSLSFLVIYAVFGLVHVYQAREKAWLWMLICMGCGSLAEVIGWAGRVWSYYNLVGPGGQGFIMQISCLIIGPSFFSAALYILLGRIIGDVAPHNSKLSAKALWWLFIAADFVSLTTQGIGGGIAGSGAAEQPVNETQTELGGNIMLGGIVFQLLVMLAYVVYGATWVMKSSKELRAASSGYRQMLAAMALCALCIIVRGVFRTGELAQGFSGSIAHNQDLFLLDAIPISITVIALNLFHPSRLLPTEAECQTRLLTPTESPSATSEVSREKAELQV